MGTGMNERKNTAKTKRRFRYLYFQPYKTRDEFKLYKLAKDFFIYTLPISANMPRSYKTDGSIGKDFYELSRNMVRKVRQANAARLGTRLRYEKQMELVEDLENLCDLFDALETQRLITPAQNGELAKRSDELKFQFEIWFDSDRRQIEEQGIEDRAADIRIRKSCWT